VLVQLALAYHARGQLDAARSTLSRARNLPRTPREQANYVAAVGVLQN
jgi:hypothetical protein